MVGANPWYIVGEDHWYMVGANPWYILAEDYWYIVARGVTASEKNISPPPVPISNTRSDGFIYWRTTST